MKKFPLQYTIRFRKNVDSRILEFADMQGNLSDTILYLIEKEISENGIRNLQEHIPVVRNILDNIEKDKKTYKRVERKKENINEKKPKPKVEPKVKKIKPKSELDTLEYDIPKEYLDM